MNSVMQVISSVRLHDLLFGFVFYYPLVMSWIWIIGGLLFYLQAACV
jgi:biofilm PGA synthesis N-glycosyltransferase PgaC